MFMFKRLISKFSFAFGSVADPDPYHFAGSGAGSEIKEVELIEKVKQF